MADSTAEKKHAPSWRRLRDARQRGQVAISRDLSASAGLLAATGVFMSMGAIVLQRLNTSVADGLNRLGDAPLRDISEGDLVRLVTRAAMFLAITVGPVAAAAAGTAVLLSGMQTNFNWSTKALTID
jgi:flagellar biosynthesis protein FlhB